MRLFYPGTEDESLAQPIHVNAGEEMRLSTITLPAPVQNPVKVSFRFLDTDGKDLGETIARSFLVALPNLDLTLGPGRTSVELTLGRYDQVFAVAGSAELYYGHATFDVGNADVKVDIPVSPGLRITGGLELEDASGNHSDPPDLLCKLYTDAPHAERVGAFTNYSCFGGLFSPALYELEIVGMPPDAYVESAQADRQDVRAAGLQLTTDTELKIVLRTPGSVIEGLVRNSSGEKLSNAVVALVPDAPLRSAGVLYRSIVSDINGRYQLRGIAPGSYHLFAWSELAGAAYRNELFLRDFEDKGQAVRIEELGRRSIDVTAF